MNVKLFALLISVLCCCRVSFSEEIILLSGSRIQGHINAFDRESLRVIPADNTTPLTIPYKSISKVNYSQPSANPVTIQYDQIELTDGTVLRISQLKVMGKEVVAHPLENSEGKFILKPFALSHLISWLRSADNLEYQAEWAKLLGSRGKRDFFVVRQSTGLNPLIGTLLEGNADGTRVKFERDDGQQVSLPLSRATGGLLLNPPQQNIASQSLCRVVDIFGNRIEAAKLIRKNQGMQVVTVSGVDLEYQSLDSLITLDFSRGNITYLSDLSPSTDSPKPEEDGPLGDQYPLTYKILHDSAINSELILEGQKYSKAVTFVHGITATYQLGGKYRIFQALAGISDYAKSGDARFTLIIDVDGRQILSTEISQSEKPVPININVKDAKELKIRIERSTFLLGNQVTLFDARLGK